MTRALDRDGEGTLALRREARLAARFNLATLRQEPAQAGNILVINLFYAIGSEDVYAATTTGTTTTEATTAATATAIAATTATTAIATTATAAPAIIGARRAVIARPTIARSERRALLIHHRLFLPHD